MSQENTQNDKIQALISPFPGLLSPANSIFALTLLRYLPKPHSLKNPALAMAPAYLMDNLDITAPLLPLGNQNYSL